MTSARWRLLLILLGCATLYAQNPIILSITPPTVPAGAPGATLSIAGANFTQSTLIFWNDVPLATFASGGGITATVPAWLLTAPGSATIVAINPGNLRSNLVAFMVGTPFQITTPTLPAGTADQVYSASLTASGGTAPYTWSATGQFPPGITLTTSGQLTGTPATAGRFDLTVQVVDAAGQIAIRTFSLTITPPILSVSTASLPQATAGEVYSHTLTAAGGIAPLRWAVSSLPDGLRLDTASGNISGTPTTPGSFNLAIQVSDAGRNMATRTLTLVVNPAPPSITTVSPLFNGTVGVSYAQTLSVAGGVPPYRWSIAGGDAGGLTLDSASGTLRGTPQAEGTYSFTVQVSDSGGRTATRAFSITVERRSLVITTGSLPAGTVGSAYTQTLSVAGGTTPYVWSVAAGGIPGMTLAPFGLLSGVPTEPGPFSITLSVRDASGISATRTYTIVISAAALKINPLPDLPEATLSNEFSHSVTAFGGVPPYVWSANGLPEGLTINAATGVITGTPTAAGLFPFTVLVRDAVFATSLELFRIRVNLPASPPAGISGLPQQSGPAQQFPLQITLASPYPSLISGQALLSFAPDSGGSDGTIQFASGGRTANFTIPAGATEAMSAVPLAMQTGTVAGTITVSIRLTAGGIDITPSPAPSARVRIERAAPTIESAQLVRSSNGIAVEIIGYSTAREVTQLSVTFAASGGQTLQNSTVTVPVENAFNAWFSDPLANQYGSQFFFRQPFTITGDANAVTVQSVTLTNRDGSTTAEVSR